MASFEEANEAYRYIGFPGYNPHIKKDVFQKHYQKIDDLHNSTFHNDKEKLLLINSMRVFNIAENGKNYVEREELARNYFDRVMAVESKYDGNLLLQIYIVNKGYNKDQPNIYSFRPIKKNSYLFHKLIKNGFIIGKISDLKKHIDWTYLPLNLSTERENIEYICASSYFKRNCRKRLMTELQERLENNEYIYEYGYNWMFWPNLD